MIKKEIIKTQEVSLMVIPSRTRDIYYFEIKLSEAKLELYVYVMMFLL
jgi:hypothetical protein